MLVVRMVMLVVPMEQLCMMMAMAIDEHVDDVDGRCGDGDDDGDDGCGNG